MDRVLLAAADRWAALSPRQRRSWNALALVVVLYIAHSLVFTIAQPFYIEDAGISFAYARNLLQGWGLTPLFGGERVEGYSNPLWTFLIAVFLVLKVPVWVSSKALGVLFGALTLLLVTAITRRARDGREDGANVLPAFLLAACTPFVVWNASGLENSLFNVLLTAALYRTIREGTEGGRPWSAVLYLLLALTRPEGPAYAVIGLAGHVVFRLSRHQGVVLSTLVWLALFAGPLALYHGWRYDYFSWPWPNTYYAKMGASSRFKPFDFNVRGWAYANKYLTEYWVAWVFPLLFFAAAGLRRWRGVVAVALAAILGLLLAWNGKALFLGRVPGWSVLERNWETVQTGWIYGSAVVLAILTLGRPGWKALSTTWAGFCAVFLYVVYTGGDWMKCHRWMSLVAPTLCILLGLGLVELVQSLPGMHRRVKGVRVGRPVLALGALVLAAPNVWGSANFVWDPETGVRDVYRRVLYMKWIQERLHQDHITLVDVDMGAHMWTTDWDILDVAGLIDVAVGHHDYEKEFIREYMLLEHDPEYIHSHGSWSKRTRLNTFAEFKSRYFEIPGYPVGGRTLHVGNYAAKRMWAARQYEGPPGRMVPFGPDLTLEGWELPSPEVARGGRFFFQTWLRSGLRKAGVRVLVFLADGEGVRAVREAVPGYGWYPPKEWKRSEHVFTGYDLPLPPDLPEGEYKVGIVLLDEVTGAVLPAFSTTPPLAPAGTLEGVQEEDEEEEDEEEEVRRPVRPARVDEEEEPEEPEEPVAEGDLVQAEPPHPGARTLYMQGEYILPVTLKIVPSEEAQTLAEADLARSLQLADQSACEDGWAAWWEARRHVITDPEWIQAQEPDARLARARCHVSRAERLDDPTARAASLIEAVKWAPYAEDVQVPARALAAELMANGRAYQDAEDWEQAYSAFRAAVELDPRLSMARRLAEHCRDERLKIKGKGDRTFLDSFIDPRWKKKTTARPAAPKATPGDKKPLPKRPSELPVPRSPDRNPVPADPEPDQGPGDAN